MTNKIEQLSRKDVENISADMLEAMKVIAEKYDVKIAQKGSIKFGATDFSISLNCELIGDDGVSMKDKEEFEHFAYMNEISPDGFGKEIELQGKTFIVTGASSRAKKYPIKAKCLQDGKSYKLPLQAYTRTFK